MDKYSYLQKAQEVLDKFDLGYSLTEKGEDELPLLKPVQQAQHQTLRDKLCHKRLHGVFTNQTVPLECDQKATHAWLNDGRLRPTTEGLFIAAQEGVVHTRDWD